MNRIKHLWVLTLALLASGGLAYRFVPEFEVIKMIILAIMILIGSEVFYQLDRKIAIKDK